MSEDRIRSGLAELARLALALGDRADEVGRIADRYATTLRGGGTLYFAGNGGSAADAQHLATEYVVRFRSDRKPLRAAALTTDSSLLTAAGNDLGFDRVFARQVEAFCGPGDLLVLHSTTGESENLLQAARMARVRGTPVVAFLGGGGGRLAALADVVFVVPTDDRCRIQELHLAVEHLIVGLVEEALRT